MGMTSSPLSGCRDLCTAWLARWPACRSANCNTTEGRSHHNKALLAGNGTWLSMLLQPFEVRDCSRSGDRRCIQQCCNLVCGLECPPFRSTSVAVPSLAVPWLVSPPVVPSVPPCTLPASLGVLIAAALHWCLLIPPLMLARHGTLRSLLPRFATLALPPRRQPGCAPHRSRRRGGIPQARRAAGSCCQAGRGAPRTGPADR